MTRTHVSQLVEHWNPNADPDEDARLVARSMMLGRARGRAAERRTRRNGAIIAVALTALMSIGYFRARDTDRGASTMLSLPSGDTMTVVEGTAFGMSPADSSRNHIQLERGAILFDVRSRQAGAVFEVATPSAAIRVLGTVFAVEVDGAGRTSVEVFEGRVEVEDRRGVRRLGAHERDGSSDSNLLKSLAELGRERAAQRTSRRASDARAEAVSHAPGALVDETSATATDSTGATSTTSATRQPDREVPRGAPTEIRAVSERAPRAVPRERAAELRSAIARGEAARVLDELPLAHVSERDRAWLHADALRAVGRSREAIEAYRSIAATDDPEQHIAAYLGARLLLDTSRAEEALRLLERARAARDSSLHERILALRGRALHATGNRDALQVAAREYLTRFPAGASADFMRSVSTPSSDTPSPD